MYSSYKCTTIVSLYIPPTSLLLGISLCIPPKVYYRRISMYSSYKCTTIVSLYIPPTSLLLGISLCNPPTSILLGISLSIPLVLPEWWNN